MTRAAARSFALALALVCVLGLAVPLAGAWQDATPQPGAMAGALPAGVEVVASGLTNPRGFTWGANGEIFIALAGIGGDSPGTLDDGTPFGLFGGPTSSVARIEAGCAVPIAEGLASTIWADVGWVWGIMDLAILDDHLYALSSGGGIEGGLPDVPNGVYRINADGTADLVADFSAWFRENPPDFIAPDYGQDGSLFSLKAGADALWANESVAGRLMRVTPDGEIDLVTDLSVDHPVFDGIAVAPDGGVYFGSLTAIPYPEGAAKVVHVSPDGVVTDHWTGLTAVTSIAVGPDGTLYAEELGTDNLEEPPFLRPNSGRIVRMTGPDGFEEVVTDIPYPVGLNFGPDGAMYVTYPAFGPDAGVGQGALLRIDLAAGAPISLAGLGELAPTCATATGGMAPSDASPTP